MSKTVILVAKCVKVTKFKSINVCEFNFKGVCNGQAISSIELESDKKFQMEDKKDYLIYADVGSFSNKVLIGSVLKVKELTDGIL